jgi:hypothetical protein
MLQAISSSENPIQPQMRLSAKLEKVLFAYASAATAAGVGLLALTQSAEARIVYTSANVPILPKSTVPLDLNHDGVADFSFKDTSFTTSFGGGGGALSVVPAHQANQIWGHLLFTRRNASALYGGVEIGTKGKFAPGTNLMASTQVNSGLRHRPPGGPGTCSGPWANVTNRYLALKFVIQGKIHLGWARLSVSCPLRSLAVTATLTGYAYETVPGKAIRTGQRKDDADVGSGVQEIRIAPAADPATLGRLAQGAQGLAAWRRKENANGE